MWLALTYCCIQPCFVRGEPGDVASSGVLLYSTMHALCGESLGTWLALTYCCIQPCFVRGEPGDVASSGILLYSTMLCVGSTWGHG